jgi:hypothetical protein
MESVKYYENSPMPAKVYSLLQKWLLLFALIIGFAFDRLIVNNVGSTATVNGFAVYYGSFWLLYAAVFYFLTFRTSARKADAWILLGSVIFLLVRYAVYNEQYLGAVNLLVIPCILMLHSAAAVYDVPKGKEVRYFGLFFSGWFVRPFSAVHHCFLALSSALGGGKGSVSRKVLKGLLASVPIAAVVIALLVNADSVLSFYGKKLLGDFNAAEFLWHAFLTIVMSALFFSFIYNAAWGKHELKETAGRVMLDRVSVSAVLIVLIAAYALFTYIQFAYLFGSKGLPAGLTYSEYARKGFSELLWVAAINLLVYAVISSRTEKTILVKTLLYSLLGFTLVILFSGVVRLVMYIKAYNLTMMRILPMWFMIWLVFAVIMCAAKLAFPKILSNRIIYLIFIFSYDFPQLLQCFFTKLH